MASAINLNLGQNPKDPRRTIFATVDFAAIEAYAPGGHLDTVLSAALVGLTFRSIPQACTDGSTPRYATVVPATGKIQLFSDVACSVETTSDTDLSAYTVIPLLVIGD